MTLEQTAAALWRQYPHLQLAHGDIASFAAALSVACPTDSAELATVLRRENTRSRRIARRRLAALRQPDRATSGPLWDLRGNRLTLWAYGRIGRRSITAAKVRSVLDKHRDVASILVRIASAGGEAVDAAQIGYALIEHPARVTAIVDFFAYSAATDVACAADRILMRSNATWMVHSHRARFSSGTADELQSHAQMLRSMDTLLRGYYLRRRGRKGLSPHLDRLLKAEAYLSAEQALAVGFVDQIIAPLPEFPKRNPRKPHHESPTQST